MSKVWVDADATPKKIKEILFRAAQKRRIPMIFVANCWLDLPRLKCIQMKVVAQGFDKADDYIAENCEDGDLIITSDIPLADRCIEQRAQVVTARGRVFDAENIKPALSARNTSEDMRNSGIKTGGPPAISPKNIQTFSNALDRWIQQR
jgi:uncharacterized protein YaiI (UPF0178 family)